MQIDLAFRRLAEELSVLSTGIIYFRIGSGRVTRFGIRHNPLSSSRVGKEFDGFRTNGLCELHRFSFRRLAVQAIKRSNGWDNGEIRFSFVMKNDQIVSNIHYVPIDELMKDD